MTNLQKNSLVGVGGGLVGLYVAYSRNNKGWGYFGWFLFGGIVAGTIANTVYPITK